MPRRLHRERCDAELREAAAGDRTRGDLEDDEARRRALGEREREQRAAACGYRDCLPATLLRVLRAALGLRLDGPDTGLDNRILRRGGLGARHQGILVAESALEGRQWELLLELAVLKTAYLQLCFAFLQVPEHVW